MPCKEREVKRRKKVDIEKWRVQTPEVEREKDQFTKSEKDNKIKE